MAHFAVLCPDATGHLNPMTTLLAELTRRGHQVTWVGTVDGADIVRPRGFDAVALGESRFPRGSLHRNLEKLGQLSGFAAAKFALGCYRDGMEAILEEAPVAIKDCGATALIADESIFAARTVAELTSLPWMTVCNALPFHPDPDHPPVFPPLSFRTGPWARIRNWFGSLPARMLMRPIRRVVAKARQRHGLSAYDMVWRNASELATIAQVPEEFDYPRRDKPDWFHYVGALHDVRSRPPIDFPFERLDDRPLIYASLGTVQNRLLHTFHSIAAACQRLPAQLVISLGGGAQPDDLGNLPGDPMVVGMAPQLDLIQRAQLVITHAGMNTTMESLAQGVPMVAIPITNDQPAVATRISWTGSGEVVPIGRVTADRIADAVQRVLNTPSYAQRARCLGEANRRAGGVTAAADIVERSVAEVRTP